jgi:HSP20 family protein
MTFLRRTNAIPVRRTRLNNHPVRNTDLWSAFDDFFNMSWPTEELRNLETFTPALNVRENESAYFVEAELPGVDKEGIDVTIKDNTLFLKGEKKTFNEETKEDYHHIERTYGSFHRAVPLAKDADAEKVKADFKNGLLTIEIGKKDQDVDTHRRVHIG